LATSGLQRLLLQWIAKKIFRAALGKTRQVTIAMDLAAH